MIGYLLGNLWTVFIFAFLFWMLIDTIVMWQEALKEKSFEDIVKIHYGFLP